MPSTIVNVRFDDRLVQELDTIVKEEREREGEPTIKRSTIIRKMVRAGIAARKASK